MKDCLNDGGQIVDPDLADREWDRKTDLSRAPVYVRERAAARSPAAPAVAEADDDGEAVLDMADASAREKHWRAKLAELKFKEAAGELVPAAGVKAELESVFRSCRTKLLGIPSRARAAMPGLSLADVAKIEAFVREALEDLARGEMG